MRSCRCCRSLSFFDGSCTLSHWFEGLCFCSLIVCTNNFLVSNRAPSPNHLQWCCFVRLSCMACGQSRYSSGSLLIFAWSGRKHRPLDPWGVSVWALFNIVQCRAGLDLASSGSILHLRIYVHIAARVITFLVVSASHVDPSRLDDQP